VNDDHEFRERVLVILTDVQTKMNSLVGADGTNGRVGNLEAKVFDLQQQKARSKAIGSMLARVWAAGSTLALLWAGLAALARHIGK